MYRGRRIGVVIPAYNVERSIRKVIEGIPEWVDRVIVVDDASRDETLETARGIASNRLIVLHHEVNKISRILGSFPDYLLFRRFWYRIYQKYVLRDFSPVALFLFLGLPFFFFGGIGFGADTWWRSWAFNEIATTGTVMLSVLPFLIGFDLIMQSIMLDIQGTPK